MRRRLSMPGRRTLPRVAGAWATAAALAACAQPVTPSRADDAAGPAATLLEAIRADAAQRTGLPASTIELAAPQRVSWSDGSLGCPMPERMYTQALVPGWRIVVQAGSRRLDYHASLRGTWLYCPADRVRPPATASRQ